MAVGYQLYNSLNKCISDWFLISFLDKLTFKVLKPIKYNQKVVITVILELSREIKPMVWIV